MGNPKTILIIDDDVSLAGLIKYQLEAKGFRVLTAPNGAAGLQVLKTVTPHLIILDINMPQMNGIEFYRNITTSYGHPRYPVLVLTSRAEFQETFKQVEARGFVPKPFLVDVLIAEVERIVTQPLRPIVFLIDTTEDIHPRKIAEILVKEQYEVVGIPNLQEAKKIAELQKPRFILLEFTQKNMAGETLLKTLKDSALFKDIPVLAYSYSGAADAKEKSLKAGANHYLAGPLHYEEFLKVLKQIELQQKG